MGKNKASIAKPAETPEPPVFPQTLHQAAAKFRNSANFQDEKTGQHFFQIP
jgi:hypothetical protein